MGKRTDGRTGGEHGGTTADEHADEGTVPAAVATWYRAPFVPQRTARERSDAVLRAVRETRAREHGLPGARWGAQWAPRILLPRGARAAAAVLIVALGATVGAMALRRVGHTRGAAARTTEGGETGRDQAHHVVRFQLTVPPAATEVALVGDFNGWNQRTTPLRRLPVTGADRSRAGARAGTTSTWVADVPIPVGRHVYAFVIDGTQWVPDPEAPLVSADGYGVRRSVVVVGGGT
jgi:hypothetical protein